VPHRTHHHLHHHRHHSEGHVLDRIGWLRAAVLGANDGVLSTASLMLGVAAASQSRGGVLLAGVAGLAAGAMSMAAGEYVSVSAQADTEGAELERERLELHADPDAEHHELARIYVGRGLDPALAEEVARQLADHDALGAHARDELGISPAFVARPAQAAAASGASFAAGALVPLLIALVAPALLSQALIAGGSIASLAVLGALGAWTGGAPIWRGVLRVSFWGVVAMAVTYGVGRLFGAHG
jgi:VIT1/CCC1 family predicted Fe2+/Mn2+ transporter